MPIIDWIPLSSRGRDSLLGSYLPDRHYLALGGWSINDNNSMPYALPVAAFVLKQLSLTYSRKNLYNLYFCAWSFNENNNIRYTG